MAWPDKALPENMGIVELSRKAAIQIKDLECFIQGILLNKDSGGVKKEESAFKCSLDEVAENLADIIAVIGRINDFIKKELKQKL